MNDRSRDHERGPWSDANLEGTAATYSGDGSDDDLSPIQRFGRNVCRLTLRRLRQHADAMRRDAIAIFLLQPSAPNGASVVREPMLGDGGIEICGKIWFVSVTAQSGRSITCVSEDDGDMFDQVERLGFGNVPAVVVNPKVVVPIVRIYGRGISIDDDIEVIEIIDRDVDLMDIRNAINVMYEKHLCTPEAQVSGVSMWADAPKSCAASNAEAIAQLHVKAALSFLLFNCDVRHEQRMRAGRTDVEVVQRRADGSMVIPAEIEIKVLRERNRNGKKWSDVFNEKWMRRGVRQAAAYRDDRGANSGMLCCFDMRKEDRGEVSAFNPIRQFANDRDVALHRNFLYNSSEAWRAVQYGD